MIERKEEYPLVTIGMLSYNTGSYVIEALKSVRAQGYPNLQQLIIDDFSTDDSAEVLKKWIAENNYDCTFIEHTRNEGVHSSLNELLALAKGKYITFIGDDLYPEYKIKEQVQMLEDAGDDYGVAYGNMDYIDEEGNSLGDNNWFDEKFYKGYPVPQGNIFKNVTYSVTFFCQASLYNLHKLKQLNFRFDSRFISEDWYLNLFITRHAKAIGSSKIYCHYRYRRNSVTAVNWTDDKMYKVWMSQYNMLKVFFDHPLNNEEDNAAVYKKLHVLALQLFNSSKLSRIQKSSIAFDLFRKQPSLKNIAKCLALLVLGNLNIAKKLNKTM